MASSQITLDDPRIRQAVEDLKALISAHFPGTTFVVAWGDDPEGIYLDATVDLDDPDPVMDLVAERLVELQVDQGLPIHVIPLPTPERQARLAELQRQERATRSVPTIVGM